MNPPGPPGGFFNPATPRICSYCARRASWQNSPASRPGCVLSQENNSQKYPVNLSKNPVNLSYFIEFYGNFIFSNEAPGFAIIPKSPESARTANAGKCAFRDQPERRPDPRGQHPFRRLKNPESTGGLSSISHRRENPATANAGKCAGRAGR